MSDKDDNEDGGFHLTKDGFNCLPCRCRRNLYHKETKTTTENNITTINIVEDRSSFKVGRGITPDNNIFKPEENQLGSVAICDTGWGSRNTSRKITPEELEQRVEKLENEVDRIEEEVDEMKKILLIV